MSRVLNRTVATIVGLLVVAALVAFAAVTAEDRPLPAQSTSQSDWSPCQQVFGVESAESRLAWFFRETKVPSELVARSSGQGQRCSSTWTASADGTNLDHRLAVTFVFFEGEGAARNEAVWWLFYQDWEDLSVWDARLVSMSGNAEIEYFDGYMVAFSKNASDAIRTAARSTPDVDVWAAVQAQVRWSEWGFDTVQSPR